MGNLKFETGLAACVVPNAVSTLFFRSQVFGFTVWFCSNFAPSRTLREQFPGNLETVTSVCDRRMRIYRKERKDGGFSGRKT
jgi:hypothetical protein